MDVKTTLREQMQAMHGTLEAAVADCNPEAVARKLPGSTINSIGAIYAHTIFSEDGILNSMIRGQAPVYMKDGWAPKIGIEMPQGGMEPDWYIKMDLPLFREYAAAVYKTTDEYLSSATDADLDKPNTGSMAKHAPNVASVFLLVCNHDLMHAGQFTVVRRKLGKPVIF